MAVTWHQVLDNRAEAFVSEKLAGTLFTVAFSCANVHGVARPLPKRPLPLDDEDGDVQPVRKRSRTDAGHARRADLHDARVADDASPCLARDADEVVRAAWIS